MNIEVIENLNLQVMAFVKRMAYIGNHGHLILSVLIELFYEILIINGI